MTNWMSGQRRLRLGIIGGGIGSAVGRTHRLAIRLSESFDVVAGAVDVDANAAWVDF